MIKLSVNETKWSSLLARTRALILFISIWIFVFGREKLAGLSRNGIRALKLYDSKNQYMLNKDLTRFIHLENAELEEVKGMLCQQGGKRAIRK